LLGPETSLEGFPILSQIPSSELDIIKRQLERRINAPLTSSAGRLFDAVSAMAGVRGEVDHEAQAAIELEMLAPDKITQSDAYPFTIKPENGMLVIKLGELISAVARDVARGVPVPDVSIRFHQTVANIMVKTCRLIAKKTGINSVALSGGVFQNRLLFNLAASTLEKEGFSVISHRIVPCNDGGIALGQAVIAHYAVRDEK
jgi:hydrogenase maturation protein HypF